MERRYWSGVVPSRAMDVNGPHRSYAARTSDASPGSGGEVGPGGSCRPAAALWLLPVLLAAAGGEGEEVDGAGGGAGAAGCPARVEHGVVDDQLGAVLEQVDESDRAVRTVEGVVLLDLDHGQVTALHVEGVALPGQVLLLGEQVEARRQPLVPCGDLGKAHRGLLTSARRGGAPIVLTTWASRTDRRRRRRGPTPPSGWCRLPGSGAG